MREPLRQTQNPNQMNNPNCERSSTIDSSDFLSAIIHELKTPLNAIIGFSDILKNEIKNVKLEANELEEYQDYACEINQTALDLNELINDLLDVGQVHSGNFSVNLGQKIDVKDILKRSVRLNHDYALQRRINLKVDIADNLQPINLDPKRMKQILTNLISNAVKYSPERSEVIISAKNSFCYPEALEEMQNIEKQHGLMPSVKNCTLTPGSLEITILDHGFGMSEEQLKNLFSKYQTFNNPNSGKVDSFGLGLAITKQLVEMQNGEIEIKSELGKGTRVRLKFKL
jgi:two-component system, sensor histidine kinase and response regulator